MARRVVLQLALLGVGLGVFRVAVVPAEVCPVVTAAQGEPTIDEAADRGLAFMLDHLLTEGEWQAWRSPGEEVQLGANALLVAALAMRRQATGDEGYDDLMRGGAPFLLAQQQPDGSMHAYWNPSTHRSVPTQGRFATGEAAWALALLDDALPGEGWAGRALPTLDYLALPRARDMGFLPPLPDP